MMMTETVEHIHRNEGPVYQDSLEIGTAAKGGGLKVYFDASNLADAETRLENAIALREKARKALGVE
jgi:hypothetical protein